MGLGKTLVVISPIASNRPGLPPPQPYMGVINPPVGEDPAAASSSRVKAEPSSSRGGATGGSSRAKGGGKTKRQRVPEEEEEDDDDVQITRVVEAPASAPAIKKPKVGRDGVGGGEGGTMGVLRGGHGRDEGKGEAATSIPIIACLPQARPVRAGASQGRPSTGGISLTQAAVSKAEAARRTLEAALEPPPAPPTAQGPRGTLIVCPLSVMSNWTSQLEEHTAGSLEVSAACLVGEEMCVLPRVQPYRAHGREPGGERCMPGWRGGEVCASSGAALRDRFTRALRTPHPLPASTPSPRCTSTMALRATAAPPSSPPRTSSSPPTQHWPRMRREGAAAGRAPRGFSP